MLNLAAFLALSSFDAATVEATPIAPVRIEVAPIESLADARAPGFELAAAEDKPAEPVPHGWTGSVAASASVSTGNTDETKAAVTGQAEERGENDRWTFQLLWNYSDEKGVGVTQRRTYGQLKYDRFLTKKFYAFGATSAESDLNAALDLRTTIGAGVGYQFIEDTEWKVSGEVGVSYVDENFEGTVDDTDFVAARLAYKADWNINDKWSLGQWSEFFPSLEDKEDVSGRVDTHTKFALTEKLFAQLQYIYTWDNTPATGADRVDELFLLALGWSF